MHACNAVTADQLLSVRDGEPVAIEAIGHIQQCALCTHELARLRNVQSMLRALPELSPPAYDAAALRSLLARSRSGRGRRWVSVVAAASVSVSVVTLVL